MRHFGIWGRMGRLRKGGIPDVNKAAITVVQDWTR
jgi:ribosome biogenesis GTPase A